MTVASPRSSLVEVFVASILLHAFFLFREALSKHNTENGRQAARFLSEVRVLGKSAIIASLQVPLLTIGLVTPYRSLILVGVFSGFLSLYLYEYAFVRAGQLPPLS